MAQNYPITDMPFDLSDFFEFNSWILENNLPPFPECYGAQHLNYTPDEVMLNAIGVGNSSFQDGTINRSADRNWEKKVRTDKVAFKTKSEIEILDDGFKWRKYGKKMVKSSPNPRYSIMHKVMNYFKCSVEGCPVKKRVERDTEDPRYVVTTYEGIHNHEVPKL